MIKTLTVLALAVALAPCMFAGELTGQDAPDFSATKFINPPADGRTSLEDCKGDVILVKLWGVKCGPCLASMPEVQALWNRYEGKGLHVFMCERQGHTEADIQGVYNSKGLTFPQVIEGNMGGFPGVGRIPYAYVIGVDGKVIFEGSKGYVGVIDEEIKKIKYLGLGKNDVAAGLEKAATAYSEGDYAKAREDAARERESNPENEALVADADYIIKKVDDLVAKKLAAVEEAKSKRRYHDAVALLEELSGKGFKGMEVADKAKDELKDLKKEQKDELKAWEQLEKTLEVNEKTRSDGDKKKNLTKFYEKYEGTAAAEEAKALADGLSE